MLNFPNILSAQNKVRIINGYTPIQACGTHGLYLYPCTDTMHYLYSTVTFIFFQSCTSVLLHITYHSTADEQSIATCYLVCNNAL